MALVRPLVRCSIPTFAVLGNHDWLAGDGHPRDALAQLLRGALETAGVRVLENQAAAITRPGTDDGTLYIVGVGAHAPGTDDVDRALADVPRGAPRVVMMHNPASFAAIPAGMAPLALAGHTHGGQIVIPVVSTLYWRLRKRRPHIPRAGWFGPSYGAAGNRLYVTRGLGFSRLPVRINCPPEVAYFRLPAG